MRLATGGAREHVFAVEEVREVSGRPVCDAGGREEVAGDCSLVGCSVVAALRASRVHGEAIHRSCLAATIHSGLLFCLVTSYVISTSRDISAMFLPRIRGTKSQDVLISRDISLP